MIRLSAREHRAACARSCVTLISSPSAHATKIGSFIKSPRGVKMYATATSNNVSSASAAETAKSPQAKRRRLSSHLDCKNLPVVSHDAKPCDRVAIAVRGGDAFLTAPNDLVISAALRNSGCHNNAVSCQSGRTGFASSTLGCRVLLDHRHLVALKKSQRIEAPVDRCIARMSMLAGLACSTDSASGQTNCMDSIYLTRSKRIRLENRYRSWNLISC